MAFEFLFGRAVIRFEAQDQALRRSTRRLGRDVKVQSAKIGQALNRGLAGAAQTATTAFGRLGQTVSRVLPGLPPQALAAAAGIGAITLAFISSTKAAARFEKTFAEVRTLIDESKIATEDIKASLLGLPPILGSAEELTKALYQAISAGAEPAAAIGLVTTAAKLAAAGLTSTFAAVDILTTAINAYGLAATEAARLSDILFKTVELGKTTVDALAGSLGVVIPFAAQLGISFEDLTAAVATLTKGGLDTRIAVTALRGAFVGFIKQADAFRDVGVDILKVVSEEGLIGAFRALKDVTGGNIEAIKELIPDARALTAVLALTGVQFEEFVRIQALVSQATGATDIAFEKQAETFSLRATELRNTFERLKIAIGTQFLAPLTAAVKALSNFIKRVQFARQELDKFFETRAATIFISSLEKIINPFGILTKTARLFFGEFESGAEKAVSSIGMIATEVGKLEGKQQELAKQREALEKASLAAFRTRRDEIVKGAAVSAQLQAVRDLEAQNRLTTLAIINEDQKRNNVALDNANLRLQVAKETNRDILADEVATQKKALDLFEGTNEERADLQLKLLKTSRELQAAELVVRAEGLSLDTESLKKKLELEQKSVTERLALEKKTRRDLTILATQGVIAANLKLLAFERQLLGDKKTAALKAAEFDKKLGEERLRIEQTLAVRRNILGQESAQEEIARLQRIAAEGVRGPQERLAAEADAINKIKQLREESRNVALKAIRDVRKALEERGITEASQADIQDELAAQAKKRSETAAEFQSDLARGFRVNVEKLEESIGQFGQSQDLQAALERVGGFGEAVFTALAPDIGPIKSATADIATAYDEALTNVENRIDVFGQRAEQKILKVTERVANGVRTFLDERLARQLEFEGTRR